jgi:hypothetical protein
MSYRGAHNVWATANPSLTRPRRYGSGALPGQRLQLGGMPTSGTGPVGPLASMAVNSSQ